MNLMERIEEEIRTDDSSAEFISSRLEEKYKAATPKEKELIDDFFMTLTGWRLYTLINWKKEIKHNDHNLRA